jgi:3-methyladenine DNA glycosylase AlkC
MAERLKDMFFTEESVSALADTLKNHHRKFDKRAFLRAVFDSAFGDLELKQRMRHTTKCMHLGLPAAHDRAVKILLKVAPDVKGFEAMCLPDYIECFGLNDWELSLEAMAVFTKYSSSEFAIRPFIKKNSKRAMAYLSTLADDKDPNVRRFASEGCRPRLPWAMALPEFQRDPEPILPILDKLKDDESDFVRKSVANNLNDISKDHPDRVLKLCEGWYGKSKRTDWVVKHACRTMLKAGNRRAMRLFGFGDPKRIDVKRLKLSHKLLAIGDQLEFSFALKLDTKKTCKVRLEYVVTFAKAGGKTGTKVFQITENTFQPGEYPIARKHSFADMSTRKHHPGKHELAIVVNGVEKARVGMRLRAKRATTLT